MTLTNFLLIFLNTCMLVAGQFLWKFGLQNQKGGFASLSSIVQTIFSPYILGGIAIYGLTTILWLFILTRVELSLAYPIQSLAYILGIVGAYYAFGEPLTTSKIIGCLLIMAGVSVIGFSPRALS
ncbi:membrane protein [Aneurinibacillus tyrosinisolvens]|jgi:drug/metabolite transporter (DMT)-like permease|uniref:membrane protein n=1 Tax=Aneurinibacillus tyrosinisolvens TaxID=1443435 RepID=UPI00063FD01F|nr:membrane protein [Aneurinibacillus tyrosinisolvens]